jgi:hypothetical protein
MSITFFQLNAVAPLRPLLNLKDRLNISIPIDSPTSVYGMRALQDMMQS